MILLLVGILFSLSAYLLMYQMGFVTSDKAHLPQDIMKDDVDIAFRLKRESDNTLTRSWSFLTKRFTHLEKAIKANVIRRFLIKAGSPMGLLEYLLVEVLSMIGMPVILYIAAGSRLSIEVILATGIFLGMFLPYMWMKRKMKIRQHNIRRDLPSIIDLLNLCVSGGLDFMLAVNRVVKDFKKCDLTQELAEVYRQTQMGKSRREALKEFAWRTDMSEVYSFVRTLLQADRMGSPMADALKMQAEEARIRRFHRGEAMALKAPIKLLFPLFAFILPVVLVIIGGPIILDFVRNNIALGF